MVKRSTGDIEDKLIKDHFDNINDEFAQNAIELESAPTATEPLLEDNTNGIYNNSLYIRKGSTIYVFSSDSQISIS